LAQANGGLKYIFSMRLPARGGEKASVFRLKRCARAAWFFYRIARCAARGRHAFCKRRCAIAWHPCVKQRAALKREGRSIETSAILAARMVRSRVFRARDKRLQTPASAASPLHLRGHGALAISRATVPHPNAASLPCTHVESTARVLLLRFNGICYRLARSWIHLRNVG